MSEKCKHYVQNEMTSVCGANYVHDCGGGEFYDCVGYVMQCRDCGRWLVQGCCPTGEGDDRPENYPVEGYATSAEARAAAVAMAEKLHAGKLGQDADELYDQYWGRRQR